MPQQSALTLTEPNGILDEQKDTTDILSEKYKKLKEVNGSLDASGTYGAIKADGSTPEHKKGEKPMTGVFEVFRFSDWKDKAMMVVGTICAVGNGAALPVMMVVFGEMVESFVNTGRLDKFLDTVQDFLDNATLTEDEIFKDVNRLLERCPELQAYYSNQRTCDEVKIQDKILVKMTTYSIHYCIIACSVLVFGYFQVMLWLTTAERQARRVRKQFLWNILRQDIGWFDTHEAAELNTRLVDDVATFQDGLGDKIGIAISATSTFLGGFIVGFVHGWKLTLVIAAVMPLLVVSTSLFSYIAAVITKKELEVYAKAGSVAEEVFLAIRTVFAFGGQEVEAKRYSSKLGEAEACGIRKGFANGLSMGFMWFAVLAIHAVGFWYGAKLVREDGAYSVANMISVFFSVILGAFTMGNAFPSLNAFSSARGAAFTLFQLIDQILNGLDIGAKPGQTIALVGSSGCGKSTTIQLLQRFYDPSQGKVMIDGTDLRDLNIKWLRSHIGVVSQEPVLFATTIAENIRYGKEGVTMDEIVQASKIANAYDFIMGLPDKFETLVGERGAQLSGGQKQRVAIARALVRDPKILLLDEATSALDTESESIVQDSLDKARAGRTTLVVAHRLSTIKTADIIIGFNQGAAVERGTHSDLMAKQGIYYQLVINQTHEKIKEEVDDEEKIKDTITKATQNDFQRAVSNVEKDQKAAKLDEDDEEELKNLPDAPFTRLMKMNSPEWFFIALGCVGSLLNGAHQPVFAIIFSKVLKAFQEDESKQRDSINMYSLLMLGFAVVMFLTMFLQAYMFSRSGAVLTTRLRDMTFRALLRHDIAFFDHPKNSVGALTTRLATDASLVQGVTGARLGMMIMNVTTMGLAITIALVYSWKLTFLIFGFMPFLIVGGFMQLRLLRDQTWRNKEAMEGAGKIAVECFENMRTVASLLKEPEFYRFYVTSLEMTYKQNLKRAHLVGLTYSVSQAVIYFAYAAVFALGAYLIEQRQQDFHDVFLVFSAVTFGATSLGGTSTFAPDVGKAQISAKRILALIDSETTLDYTSKQGTKLEKSYEATVQFDKVHFHYPTRASVPVLQGLSFTVTPGQTLALVGSSGCGKSTSVQLIERFYDAVDGSVILDTCDIRSLNLQWLRQQIGIVSQEPVLFDRSIAENIAYGDNTRQVNMDEIIAAARGANIHNFIAELPAGYHTNVGSKGTQLSGGQKQRVAIARALVRNPKILLLDEATSALDTESEKIVQEALDKAREGRTCVVIAHRLSTIKNADTICVVSSGKVTEQGTHNELMAKQGFYFKLVRKSTRQE